MELCLIHQWLVLTCGSASARARSPRAVYVYNSAGQTVLEQLTLAATTATTGTWTINVASGTQIYFLVSDNTGTPSSSFAAMLRFPHVQH